MREFYEERWATLPEPGEPWGWAWRSALLLAHVGPGRRVLDLGCGRGDFAAAAVRAGAEVVAVDVAAAALRRAARAHPGLDLRLAAEDGPLPLEDGAVELVWASEVLEHVGDVVRLLGELRRVLAPGGRLVVTVPFHGRLQAVLVALGRFEAHFDPRGEHLRFFTARSLAELLAEAGFAPAGVTARGGRPALRETLVAVAERPSWTSAGREARRLSLGAPGAGRARGG